MSSKKNRDVMAERKLRGLKLEMKRQNRNSVDATNKFALAFAL